MKEQSRSNRAIIFAHNRGARVSKCGDYLRGIAGNLVNGGITPFGYRVYEVRLPEDKLSRRSSKLAWHRLQAYCKFGDAIFDKDILVRHLNGNSLDNSWDNIAIGSYLDNMMDKSEDSRRKTAILSTLNRKDFEDKKKRYSMLKKMIENGVSFGDIGRSTGVSKSVISYYFGNGKRSLDPEIRKAYES